MEQRLEADLYLSNSEFIMLSLLLGAEQIVGIPDVDFISQMNESQLGDKWCELKKALAYKGYIQENTDAELDINEDVFNNINAYVNAKELFELHRTNKGYAIVNSMYFISDDGITNVAYNKNEEVLNIKAIADKAEMLKTIKNQTFMTKTEEIESIDDRDAILNKSNYYEFMASVNLGNAEKAMQLLTNCGMNMKYANYAVKGFINKDDFITLTRYDLQQKEAAKEIIMFYLGEAYYFKITISDAEDLALSIKALDSNECIDDIEVFLYQTAEGIQ